MSITNFEDFATAEIGGHNNGRLAQPSVRSQIARMAPTVGEICSHDKVKENTQNMVKEGKLLAACEIISTSIEVIV